MEHVKRTDRKLVHTGSIFELYKDSIQLPDGKTMEWDFIKHKGAAAVLPVTEDGKILMVRQYREAIDRMTLELPAGGLNSPNEPMIEAAKRELEEETGWTCDELEFLISIYTAPAYCNERIDVFVARSLKPSVQHLDEGEYIEVEAHEVDELAAQILAGKIQDTKTVGAIMAYKVKYGL